MSTIERFEDIEAWREARELAGAIYAVSNEGAFSRGFGLRDQIRRAAVSVMSNIAEGYERGGRVEFRRYLSMAKGSAGEVRSQLYVALDSGLIDRAAFEALRGRAEAVSRLIAGFMRYLANDPIPR
jgi:four helix bundle protein